MKVWNDLKVRSKLLVMVGGVCLALLVVGGVGLVNMRSLSGHLGDLDASVEHVAALSEMKSSFLQMRLALIYMLALTDGAKIEEKGREFEKSAAFIKEALDRFQKSNITDAEKSHIGEFRSGFEAYVAGGAKVADMARSAAASGNPAARAEAMAFATGSVAPLYEKPAQVISSMVAVNVKEGRELYERDMAAYRRALAETGGIVLVAMVLSLVGGAPSPLPSAVPSTGCSTC